MYPYVWRNWELANLDRMATEVGARPVDLARMAEELGLPPKRQLSDDYLRRIYIIALSGWDAERFAFNSWHRVPLPTVQSLPSLSMVRTAARRKP